jgi:hypothetical protein
MRHAARFTLVLLLLVVTSIFRVEDAQSESISAFKYPACDSACSVGGQTGTCTYNGLPTTCRCSEELWIWICRE